MHELRSADPPSASGRAHATQATRSPAPATGPDRPRPSRLIPFATFGSISVTLFAIAGLLRRDPEPVLASVGDYSCLGACLSGVAAAIFGCVTVSRAVRRRRKRTGG
jgi:hypothetical protein